MTKTTHRLKIAEDDSPDTWADDEETATLPALVLPNAQPGKDEILQRLSAQFDELIALSRSIEKHLDRIAGASPRARKTTSRKSKTRKAGTAP